MNVRQGKHISALNDRQFLTAFDFQWADLGVHREQLEIHATHRRYGQPMLQHPHHRQSLRRHSSIQRTMVTALHTGVPQRHKRDLYPLPSPSPLQKTRQNWT